MGPITLFSGLLILSFTLKGASEPSNSQKGLGKPGRCPIDHIKCPVQLAEECSEDSQCFGKSKCCFISCRNRCLNPGEAQVTRLRYCEDMPPLPYCKLNCYEDKDCHNQKRCCTSFCGDICFLPQDTQSTTDT